MKPCQDASPISSDPREALGPSLFVSILHHLPFSSLLNSELVCKGWRQTIRGHEKGLWRATCHCIGVEAKHMNQLEQLERAMSMSTSMSWGGDPEEPEPEPEPSDDQMDIVNWRGVCKGFVEHDRNWRYGRVRERWITPGMNTAWRIQVDPEQKTLLGTSRIGGILVTDMESSQTLFELRLPHEYAHLEFAKGHVIFDADHNNGLYVYRTENAIKRSSRPTPPASRRPRGAEWGISSRGINMAEHAGPLPRGHLAFYRQIIPPTTCRAFRARIDRAGTPEERAVLGTAGTEAVYLYDLDDPSRVETIPLESSERTRLQYIEFDDDFVFVCTKSALLIYSRATRQKITEIGFPIASKASACFEIDSTAERERVPRGTARDDLAPTPITRITARRVGFDEDHEPVSGAQYSMPPHVPDSVACHYTSSDLICLCRRIGCLIVRDYKRLLRDSEDIWQNAIWIGFEGHEMNMLATHGTRISVATDKNVFFLDSSTLPEMPLKQKQLVTPLVIHQIRSTTQAGIAHSGCLQMDRSNIYLSYVAAHSGNPSIPDEVEEDAVVVPPTRATGGFGCCVKVWNFTP